MHSVSALSWYLNALGERLELVGGELDGGRALRDERDDGDTSMTANHRAVHLGRVNPLQVTCSRHTFHIEWVGVLGSVLHPDSGAFWIRIHRIRIQGLKKDLNC